MEKERYSKEDDTFTLWDMHEAFYAGRAIIDADENTRFQDLQMKYETFDKFLKLYEKSKNKI